MREGAVCQWHIWALASEGARKEGGGGSCSLCKVWAIMGGGGGVAVCSPAPTWLYYTLLVVPWLHISSKEEQLLCFANSMQYRNWILFKLGDIAAYNHVYVPTCTPTQLWIQKHRILKNTNIYEVSNCHLNLDLSIEYAIYLTSRRLDGRVTDRNDAE